MEEIRSLLSSVISKLETGIENLEAEQTDSEDAHADWENEEDGPTKADEPEVIDNQAEIDRLRRASNFLEKAVDELDD